MPDVEFYEGNTNSNPRWRKKIPIVQLVLALGLAHSRKGAIRLLVWIGFLIFAVAGFFTLRAVFPSFFFFFGAEVPRETRQLPSPETVNSSPSQISQ